jgi:hypothetical protein
MGASAQPVGDVHVLGRSKLWPAIAAPAAGAVILAVGAVVFHFVLWYPIAATAASLIVAVAHPRNAVLGDDIGLIIRARAGSLSRSLPWTDIERMGWQDSGMWGSTLRVYPHGGPYDVPGPNSPITVGRIWEPRRRHRPDPLPELLQRHGIKTLHDR